MTSATTTDRHRTVTDAVRRRFAELTVAARRHGPDFAALSELAATHALGGKLIRPRLLVDLHRALAGAEAYDAPPPVVTRIAAEIELLHYAFLLHDDVIDGDLVRRRRPNLIAELLDARGGVPSGARRSEDASLHWARTGAILMGDLLLSAAVLGVARADVPRDVGERLLALFDRAVQETIAGEHLDVGLSDGMIAPAPETVLAMTASKTAAYSFVLPLRAAAILADAGDPIEELVDRMGRQLGLAYQLQDDRLSVFGDPVLHGKAPFADLREGKETALIAFARRTASWPRIAEGFGRADLRADEGDRMRALLVECGADDHVRDLIAEQLAAVRADLERTSVLPETAHRVIRDLVDGMDGRLA